MGFISNLYFRILALLRCSCKLVLPPGLLGRSKTRIGGQQQNSVCFPDASPLLWEGGPRDAALTLAWLNKGFNERMRKYLVKCALYHKNSVWIPTSVKPQGRSHNQCQDKNCVNMTLWKVRLGILSYQQFSVWYKCYHLNIPWFVPLGLPLERHGMISCFPFL